MTQMKSENVRGEVPLKVLWKWTGVSAALHVAFIGVLCGISYYGHLKKEEANKAKAAAEEAALKKKEAEEAKKLLPKEDRLLAESEQKKIADAVIPEGATKPAQEKKDNSQNDEANK